MKAKIKAELPQEQAAGILGNNMLPRTAHQESPANKRQQTSPCQNIDDRTPPLQHEGFIQDTLYLKCW